MGNEISLRKLGRNNSLTGSRRTQSLESLSPTSSSSSDDKPKFRWDEGRRYHAVDNSMYALPNDDMEIDRLQTQHYMLRWAFNGLFKAPISDFPKGSSVLDVGCGPGTWTLEMAQAFPDIDAYGIDISPVFPTTIHPANTHFQLGNIIEKLPFPDGKFDFVFQRLLVLGLRGVEWPQAIQELYRVCKPGGWVEICEIDLGGKRLGPKQIKIREVVNLGLRSRGLEPLIARHLGSLLIRGGFEEVVHDFVSIPVGWGGKIGDMMMEDSRGYVKALEPVISKAMGISDSEQYEREIIQGVIEEARANNQYGNFHYAYGRRPVLNSNADT